MRLDDEPAIPEARILGACRGIILLLAIVPPAFVEGGVVGPLGGIGQPPPLEVVRPDQVMPLWNRDVSSFRRCSMRGRRGRRARRLHRLLGKDRRGCKGGGGKQGWLEVHRVSDRTMRT